MHHNARRTNVAALLCLAILGSALSSLGSPGSAYAEPGDHDGKPAKSESAGSPAACAPKDGTQLLREFFAPTPLPSETATAPAPPDEDAPLRALLMRGDVELQFLLATVPEPRLGLDGAVEAVTRAIETAGYTLDRHFLPWTPSSPSKAAPPCDESHPGVALFVHAADPKAKSEPRRLLLLYVIGETPTSGIHKQAFLQAVQETTRLRAQVPASRCLACEQVRLIGPAFSGSVTSLELLLDHFPTLSFRILSGRATNSQLLPLLTRHSSSARTVSFQATVIPDEALQSEFYCYLSQTLGADEHDIALVTESTTAYGQAVIAANAAQLAPMTRHARVVPMAGDTAGTATVPTIATRCHEPHAPRLTLPMPMHISRLHSALAKRSPAPKQDAQPSLFPNLVSTLPQLLDESLRTDVIPTLSERTLASQEYSLAQILSTISAERVRYVGIVATDVEDKLFLAYQIRTYSPDVVLFTFESDILYTYPDARTYLKGMLVVSPYPLYTRNQEWTFPFRGWQQRLQFASEADQGVYNAAVVMLGHPEQLIEYSQATPGGSGQPQSRPAIWISAVGNDSLLPIACLKDYADNGYVYQNPTTGGSGEYLYSAYQQGTLRALLLILGLVGLMLCAAYFRCYYSPPGELPAPWSWLKVLRQSGATRPAHVPAASFAENETRRQPLFMLLVFLPMWLGYLLVGAMHFMQLREGNIDAAFLDTKLPLWLRFWNHSRHLGLYHNLSWQVVAIGLIAAACELAFSLTVLDIFVCWLFPTWRARLQVRIVQLLHGTARQKRMLFTTAALIASGGTALWFMIFISAINYLQSDFNSLLFLGRSAHPAFGLSPALPLWILILDLQILGYCNLQRIALLDRLAAMYADLIEELTEEIDLRTEVSRIAMLLASPSRNGVLLALLCTLGLVVTVLTDLVSLEHYWVNFLFRFLFALLLSCTGYSFYCFMRLWYGVRRLLQLLAHHPLAAALERLPPQLARSLSVLLLEDLPDVTRREAQRQHSQLLLNHLAQLQERDLSALSPPGADNTELARNIKELRALRAAPLSSDADNAAAAQSGATTPGAADQDEDSRIANIARRVVQILKAFWAARPLPGTMVGRGEDKPSINPATLQGGRNTAEMYLQALPDTLHLWMRLCEDFIAIQVASYITRLFPHLRNSMLFVTVSVVLLVSATMSYPFQPQHYLLLVVWLLIMVTGPLTIFTLVQMNRDEVLSRISKSEPGKVTWDRRFISQLVIYGVLPLLSLVATQFPHVRGMAFSWLESLLKTLK